MPDITLVYGTNSGNTEYVAETIQQIFHQHHLPITVHSAGYVEPGQVLSADILILGSCTWEKRIPGQPRLEGQLQDQMEKFTLGLAKHNLKSKRMAVFGLGDSDYKYFCGAAVLLNQFVDHVGATKLGPTMFIDSWPQPHHQQIVDWTTNLIQLIRA